jgi:hypothetical protein
MEGNKPCPSSLVYFDVNASRTNKRNGAESGIVEGGGARTETKEDRKTERPERRKEGKKTGKIRKSGK